MPHCHDCGKPVARQDARQINVCTGTTTVQQPFRVFPLAYMHNSKTVDICAECHSQRQKFVSEAKHRQQAELYRIFGLACLSTVAFAALAAVFLFFCALFAR